MPQVIPLPSPVLGTMHWYSTHLSWGVKSYTSEEEPYSWCKTRLSSGTVLALCRGIQQDVMFCVCSVFRVTLMGSTLVGSLRLHKMEYHWAFLILMAVLEMLKAFCIKPDEGKMLSAAIIVFNPKTLLAWVLLFFFSGNHIFQLYFCSFALSLGRLLILQCLSPEFCLAPAIAHQWRWPQYCQETQQHPHEGKLQ